jgi:choline monooxygenase
MTYIISNLALQENTILPLVQFDNHWAVNRFQNQSSLISNSCLHRGAIMVREKQPYTGNLICPMHRWTYDHSGKLMGEPFANASGCLNTLNTFNWNNLLFTENPQINNLPDHLKAMINTENYVYTKTETKIIKSSWQIFMEVYVDLYHVEPYHPGLGKFVDMTNYNWHFGDTWSVQEMFRNQTNNEKNPCKYFNELNQLINAKYPEYKHAALWMTIYPNITIEWYPNTIVVATVWPTQNPNESLVINEYHHLDSVAAYDKEFIELQIAAYETTEVEDQEIWDYIQLGRTKDASAYPFHPELEKGIQKFYEFLNNNNYANMFKIKSFE